ncbi:hypothetical protein [uncultured Tateyamaria sp.]|uniref:hypothetical protein n=1 Tax=uncultured Tateyamaria sp. TaxID=455651 RepID=UPI00262131C8|nr:hypothetical protein [uncultured Tateyamaria sp.]
MTCFINPSIRLHSAILTGIGGGATAQAMSLWGGDLARFLPPTWLLTLTAVFGAACAGAILASALGRSGLIGVVICILAWPVATALGAAIAAVPFGLSVADMRYGVAGGFVTAMREAAPLGLLAVGDGITTSWVVAAVWVLSAALVHVVLRTERQVSI